MSRRQVPVGDRIELCVDDFGDPADPPVLLLAGAAMPMDWWDVDLCRRIAAGARHVIRYDHRDTGGSTTGPAGAPEYGDDALHRDALALIEALGVGPVHLVGLSSGGGVAQTVALRRPDVVATLTLVATAAAGGVDWSSLPGPAEALAQRFENPPPAPRWSDREAYVEWALDDLRAYAGAIRFDEPRARTLAGEVHDRSIDVAAAANHWIAIERGGSGDDLPPLDVRDLRAPTLVVHGTHDPMFPLPHGEALAEAIPGARLLVIEGMGHEVPPPPTWDRFVPALLAHTAQSRSKGSA
jgi:pimeloyl-ACP methyl ester carboxylesterase